MKKIISLLSLALLATSGAFSQDGAFPQNTLIYPSMDYFRVAATVSYESEYVFRAERRAGHSVQPKVEIIYPMMGFDVYGGAWMNFPVATSGSNANTELSEVDFYLGANYTYGFYVFDFGATYCWYTDGGYGAASNVEVYAGVTIDTSSYIKYNINPSLYYYYNVDMSQHVVELSTRYDIPLGLYMYGSEALTMPVRVFGGWLTSGDRLAGKYSNQTWSETYFYVTGSLDIAYMLREYCTISAGIRYSYYTSDKALANFRSLNVGGADQHFWYGVRVDFGF